MRLLLITLLSALILFASDVNLHQVKILEKILSEVSVNGELKVWSDNKEILSKIKKHGNFKTVQSCEDANIIILENVTKIKKECSGKCTFVLNYNLLSDVPQSFGALFWKKGRPNIVILEPRIKAQSITITKNLEPYLEEKIW